MPFRAAIFLSTPSVRRATAIWRYGRSEGGISIHALREEGDHTSLQNCLDKYGFLSTPSVRRATAIWRYGRSEGGISIHALREEGDITLESLFLSLPAFLSTPSVRRATVSSPRCAPAQTVFLSTPSVRRATHHHCYVPPRHWISIHALREEGDWTSSPLSCCGLYFYPRPP